MKQYVALLLIFLIFSGCSGGDKAMINKRDEIVRRTLGAGKWFPGDAVELKSMVNGYIDRAEVPEVKGRIVAAIAPHAGYVYSGKVAGYTFRALKENAIVKDAPETVIVLGFSHSRSFRGVALMDGTMLESPLGRTELDNVSSLFLTGQSSRIFFQYGPHDGEHSAENEVPFVQTVLPKAKLVIGLMGDHEEETLNDLVSALVSLSERKKILVMASTDLLHDPDYALVGRTDAATLEKISGLDDSALMQSWGYEKQVCCGIMPVLTAMRFARAMGCVRGEVLMYRNSGDDHPESRGNWVVGYSSVVFSVE